MLSPLFSQSDFTFSYHKLKITWQFHHYASRFLLEKQTAHGLWASKHAALPCKKSIESPKAKDISQKTRHISQKIRDISLKAKDISQKTRDVSRKERDILKPKAVLSIYAEDAAEIPLLKCNKINVFVKPNEQNRA